MQQNNYDVVIPSGRRAPFVLFAVLLGIPAVLEIGLRVWLGMQTPLWILLHHEFVTTIIYVVHVVSGLSGLLLVFFWLRYVLGYGGYNVPVVPLPPAPGPVGGQGVPGDETTAITWHTKTELPTRLDGVSAQYYGRHGESERLVVSYQQLRAGACTIGSAPDCVVCLRDSSVHNYHAELRVYEGKLCIKAVHRVELNGKLLEPGTMRKVRHGDNIRLGEARIVFN